ncbi:MAG: divalent-cation tolerance protein CutA [Parvularculaceae bacterium]
MAKINFLYTTAPDAKSADEIARALIERRLAACVNVIPGMTSTYRWKGKIEATAEIVLIVKTTAAVAPAARDLILELHPYDTPCVVALPILESASNQAFLDWIAAETANERPTH